MTSSWEGEGPGLGSCVNASSGEGSARWRVEVSLRAESNTSWLCVWQNMAAKYLGWEDQSRSSLRDEGKQEFYF